MICHFNNVVYILNKFQLSTDIGHCRVLADVYDILIGSFCTHFLDSFVSILFFHKKYDINSISSSGIFYFYGPLDNVLLNHSLGSCGICGWMVRAVNLNCPSLLRVQIPPGTFDSGGSYLASWWNFGGSTKVPTCAWLSEQRGTLWLPTPVKSVKVAIWSLQC